MSPEIVGLLGFAVLFGLLAMGMQIGVAMGFVGFLGMCVLYPLPGAIVKMAVTPFEVASNYNFAVMPLFIFMAQITLACGFGADLFKVASKWLGHYRGGLAIASIGAATGFAACSGSSLCHRGNSHCRGSAGNEEIQLRYGVGVRRLGGRGHDRQSHSTGKRPHRLRHTHRRLCGGTFCGEFDTRAAHRDCLHHCRIHTLQAEA